jgi:phosphoribosylglycinamide formyltransferase-1
MIKTLNFLTVQRNTILQNYQIKKSPMVVFFGKIVLFLWFSIYNFLIYNFIFSTFYFMKKIAVFASGSGSNAQKIIEYFRQHAVAEVEMILSNKKDAFVLERAKNHKIPSCSFNRDEFYSSDKILDLLMGHHIDLIVLAGFLWLVPGNLLRKYPNRIINIHPALLPKYGGKGMYGMRVHKAVVDNHEAWSGITIHYVNEHYDEGNIIFQAKCKIGPDDDAETVAGKVHELEYKHFPKVIEDVLMKL